MLASAVAYTVGWSYSKGDCVETENKILKRNKEWIEFFMHYDQKAHKLIRIVLSGLVLI